MKSIFFISILLVSISLVSIQVHCADRESANELYVKSGLEKNLRDIGPALLAGYKHSYKKTKDHSDRDRKISQKIEQVVHNSFDIRKMKEIIINGVMKDIEDAEIEKILNWLNSPEGKKITELEEISGTSKGMEETQQYIRNIKSKQIEKDRINLIRELNSAMNITETTVDIAWSTQFALSMTLAPKGRSLNRKEIEKLYKESKKDSAQLAPMVENQVYGSLLYTYQSLPDKVLEKYISFIKSGSGQKYSTITSSYMLQAISESCLQFAVEISQI